MAVVKISVAIDETDLAWARARAKREKVSLSSVLSEAVRQRRQMEARDDVLAEMHRHHPLATVGELEAIFAEWEGSDDGADVRHGRADRDRAIAKRARRAARDTRVGRRAST
jgi:hypothetical protein